MKIPLLPDADMARIAPQPRDYKRHALEVFKLKHPPYRYSPVRKSYSDIVNAQTGFLPVGLRPPFEKIAKMIREDSQSDAEYQANIRVAQALYEHATETDLVARHQNFLPLTLGGSSKLTYWHSVVLVHAGEPLVPFIDPRRESTKLTTQGRQFAFSVMHERIRALDPDYAEVRLGIFQFTSPKEGRPRKPILYTDEHVELFSFDDLDEMVRETNEIWTEVFLERTERVRRSGRG